jgi:hypothetical protein
MDQKSFLAITAMLNSFPQGQATDQELLLRTYEAVLRDVSSEAITETAERFSGNRVTGQSDTFAPSVAQFATEARRMDGLIPYRNRPRLAPPERAHHHFDDPKTRIRMGFKMSVLSAGIGLKRVDEVARANAEGLDSLMALAQQWGVPIPEELFNQRAA